MFLHFWSHLRRIVMAATLAMITIPAGWALTPAAGAEIIQVSAGESIQAAIDRAVSGDTILVGPGTYQENLIFRGKDLILRSSAGPEATVLDGGGIAPVLRVMNGETRAATIEGFTIRNGGRGPQEWPYPEGAIFIWETAPTIIGNIVTGTTLCSGGAVNVQFGAPLIERNSIRDNHVQGCYYPVGGGITINGDAADGMAVIRGNQIENNTQWNGGGIGLYAAGQVRVENNVIRNNHASVGGGMYLVNYNAAEIVGNLIVDNDAGGIGGSVPTGPSNWGAAAYVLNNTIARNQGPAVDLWGSSVAIAGSVLTAPAGSPVLRCTGPFPDPWSMSDDLVWNGGSAPLYSGESGPCGVPPGTAGVMAADPGFVDGSSTPGDFRLRSSAPGIDEGFTGYGEGWLPATDLAGMPRIADGNGDGTAIIDMGAYELGADGVSPPGMPTQLAAKKIHGSSLLVTWQPPADDGGAPVTSYVVKLSPSGQTALVPADQTSITFTGLTRRTSYTVAVSAVNRAGTGPAATTVVRL
jgi:nitrous oxidase accessory protein NosD